MNVVKDQPDTMAFHHHNSFKQALKKCIDAMMRYGPPSTHLPFQKIKLYLGSTSCKGTTKQNAHVLLFSYR